MDVLRLSAVSKAFGAIAVLHDIDLSVGAGEFVVFVGPSGCGKSTLLRVIAGLEPVTDGTIEIDGVVVNDLDPAPRGVAMVFQSYALYPHMTARRNMSFGLKIAGFGRDEVSKRVGEAARALQIEPLLDRLPKNLSGGQRQRVAIGRAIVREPKLFLFDEPLSNLDAALRVQTRVEIAKLHKLVKATMIYVTHDQVEAMTLADRIVVLNAGRIEQVGTPLELYRRPANLFVAGFIGSPQMNFVPVMIDSGSVRLPSGEALPLPTSLPAGPGTLGVRPESLAIASGNTRRLSGMLQLEEHLGEHRLVHVRTAEGQDLIAKLSDGDPLDPRAPLSLTFDPQAVHLFGPDGEALLHGLMDSRSS
ncbi:MAG: sn-glycerol-3-phosphate ABC transporter ATP-binding protein UgpC [Fimbriimonadaceae bacterium]|nr:sn-glycerol-3-phosphate ABC transporter ATP-binding protein UgpC [Fimbriimonadaceae bacterium]